MEWYDSFIILGIITGVFLAFFGSYHGKNKNGFFGLILIMLSLIVKASIWFASLL
ncbi:MAG: hypothetical protein ABIH65_01630 [Nanoarchaeota archaeon]